MTRSSKAKAAAKVKADESATTNEKGGGEGDTWLGRVLELMADERLYSEPRRYTPAARRSLQSAVLLEALRIVRPQLEHLKPWQRKWMLSERARQLVDSFPRDVVTPKERGEILWRTATCRENVSYETAFKRAKTCEKELRKLASELEPIVPSSKEKELSHRDAVDRLALKLYVRQLSIFFPFRIRATLVPWLAVVAPFS